MHPAPAEATFPTMLGRPAPHPRVYPKEAAVARAGAATFERRRTPLPTTPPLALTLEFAQDRAKQRARLGFEDETLGEGSGLPAVMARRWPLAGAGAQEEV